MSELDSIKQAAPSTADGLLKEAIQSVSKIVSPYMNTPTEAILVIGHALIAKLDLMETSLLKKISER